MPTKKTHEQFIHELSIVNPNIEVLGNYINARTKISVRCKIDGYIWDVMPDNLLRKTGCPFCAGKVITTSSFKNKVKEVSPQIIVYGEYVNNTTPMKCFCVKHNVYFYSDPVHLLRGQVGCSFCKSEKISQKIAMTAEDFILRLHNINPKLQLISEYVNIHKKVLVKCLECGKEFYIIPNNAYHRGVHCKCEKRKSISKGELRIFEYLLDNDIKFIYEHSFDDLHGINGGLLTYDFYLTDLNLLVEYQGEQHEHSVEYFGGEEKFKIQQEHDRRKRIYSKEHSIPLLEIWYYDLDNIPKILNNRIAIIA